jgi:hypothetical protein
MILYMTDYACSVHGQFSADLTWSFGVRMTSGQTAQQLLTTWESAWSAAWTNATYGLEQFYPVATQVDYFRVASLDATMHETQNFKINSVIPGTATGDTLPYLNATVVSQRSAFSKRFNRGRFYLPAMEETFVNNNVLDPAAAVKIGNAVRSVFTSITADGSTVFVTSLKPHKDGTGQYQKTPIILWEVSNKPARQARRVKKQVAVYT